MSLRAFPLYIFKLHRATRASVAACGARLMRSESLLNIVGDAGVERLVTAAQDIHEVHFVMLHPQRKTTPGGVVYCVVTRVLLRTGGRMFAMGAS